MNERIRALYIESSEIRVSGMGETYIPDYEKFAELIVKECTDILRDTFDCHFEAEQIEEHFGVK